MGTYLNTLSDCKSYRIGGDEFAILTYIEEQNKIYPLAQQILENIRNLPAPETRFHPTASIGILANLPRFCNGEEWYRQTDKELYEAKRQRDSVVYKAHTLQFK